MSSYISKILRHSTVKKGLYLIYSIIWLLILPIISLRLLIKSKGDPEYRKRLLERLGVFKYNGPKNGIWIHAVSLGEVMAAMPLIKDLIKLHPDIPITVTTMTPAGSDRVKKHLQDQVFHVYIPYDISMCLNLYLKKIKPRLLVCIETEIWPNLVRILNHKSIPVIICNARMSKRSAKKYARFNFFTKPLFQKLRVLAISRQDAKRFKFLGTNCNNVTITGSVKYDLRLPHDFQERVLKIKNHIGGLDIFLAASTHHNEEEIILDIFKKIKLKYPDLILFLVPRHPARVHKIYDISVKKNFKTILRTEIDDINTETDVILGNTIGELLMFYSLAKVVFIGGSLIEHGGHNPLEAAIFGKPIITGEHIFNFSKIYNILNRNNGCIITSNNLLQEYLDKLLSEPETRKILGENAKNVFEKNGGALEKQLFNIEKML